MAVSIVSKQYGDDSQSPVTQLSANTEALLPTVEQDIPVIASVNQDLITTDEKPIQETSPASNENGRLNDLHPEEVINPIEDKPSTQESSDIVIPNMYIKADTEAMDVPSDVAIFSEEKKESTDGFDMDDLLGDESPESSKPDETLTIATPIETIQTVSNDMQQVTTQDPFVQKKEETQTQEAPISTKKPLPAIAPKKSLTKSLAMAAAGLFGVVVIGFVVMTMFPAGIDWSEWNNGEIIAQEPLIEEPLEEHTAAEEKTPQEIARWELVNYSTLGEEYYTLGRDLKDRNMVRYALYVEKKAKDLIDLLDLDPNMDTKEVVVYFAQFDDYLKTLAEWKAGLGDSLPIPSDSSVVQEDMFAEPTDAFTDIQTDTIDETNTWSTQSGTSLTEPEQSELSDW